MSKEDRELKRQERKDKAKVPFKDRPIAQLLKTVAPAILNVVADVIPGGSAIKMISDMVLKDKTIPKADKETIQRELDRELEEYKLYVEDINAARTMYSTTGHDMADQIATRVIKWNLWVVLLAVVIEIGFVYFIDDKILIATVSTIIGSITTALLQERQQIINFFFGSSKGSKDKDKLASH